MRLASIGLRALPLATRVYYTHRASSTNGTSLTDVRSRTSASAAWRLLLDKEQASAEHDGYPRLPRPQREFASGMTPTQLTKWVAAWPAAGYGHVVDLTYRAEGIYHPAAAGSWEHPNDLDPPYLDEHDRHPLYVVKQSLRGFGVLVPPWAIYPLTDRLIEFGSNPPLPVAPQGEPAEQGPTYLNAGRAFGDYADSLIALIHPKEEDPDADSNPGRVSARQDQQAQA